MPDVGYYTLPVILSFEGVDKQVNSKLGKAFDGIGKKAGKDISSGISSGTKAAEADIKKLADSYGKLRDKASDSLGKVKVAEAQLADARTKGNASRIVAAEERLATARRNSTRATREASSAHDTLKSAQNSLVSGSDKLNGKLGALSGVAARVGPALAAVGAAAGAAAVAGVALLAAGAVKAAAELYQLGAQFDDTFDNIRIKTGATGDELDKLKDSVKRIGPDSASSIGEIGNVVAEVTRNLHLTGPALDDVSKSILDLGRLTGEAVDVKTLGQAFRKFGVDVKDQVPTLDSLFKVGQKTGLGVNELLASVVKGGPALRDLGLSVGQSAALLAQFEAVGIDSTVATKALTKAQTVLAKDGKTLNEGLAETFTQIKNLSEAESVELSTKVFGKEGAKFSESIRDGTLDLQQLRSMVDGTGDTIANAAADTDDWSERWQKFKNLLAVKLEPIASGVFDELNTQLTNLADWVTSHRSEIIDFFIGIGNAAVTMAEVTVRSFGLLTQGVGQIIAPFGDIQGAMLDFQAFQAELRGDDEAARNLRDQAQAAYGWGEQLYAAGEAMKNFDGKPLHDALNNLGDAAKTSGENVAGLSNSISGLPESKDVKVTADTQAAALTMDQFLAKYPMLNPNYRPPPITPSVNPMAPLLVPGAPRAYGGAINGVGGPRQDNVPILASVGEHMFSADDVNAMGGQRAVYQFRRGLHGYASGGAIDVQTALSMVGTPYSQANRTDCSGMVARVINSTLGLPGGGLMSTKNASQWLAERGFVPGKGGPGTITVGWYDHGPNPNDGHMAMTLSDGSNAEAGGSHGTFLVGAGAQGASAPKFDQHMYLPTLFGEGEAGSASLSYGTGGTASGGTTSSSGGGGAGAVASAQNNVTQARGGLAEAQAKERELPADAKESERIAARNDVTKATNELTEAETALADARSSATSDTSGAAASSSKGGDGLDELKQLPSMFANGLLETLGIGDIFPDLTQSPMYKSFAGGLSALKGPIQGLVDGKLGIQQPGWSPGMPITGSGDAASGVAGGGGLPMFGLPNIELPQGPGAPGAAHLNGGTPGPSNVQHNDMSITYNGPVGSDPAEVQRRNTIQQDKGLAKVGPIAPGN